jgi:16S rRNA (uracil1498-N3)-methyltransferase
MKIHRFIGAFEISGNTLTVSDKALIHQISRVLKLKHGEHVIFGDGKGNEAVTVLETVTSSYIEATINSKQTNQNEPTKAVTLYLAVLKKDNFELSIQKAVEIGVSRIVPVLSERTVKMGINQERLESIIREAAEQSGRGTIPELSPACSFIEALNSCDPKQTILFDLSGVELGSDSYETATSLFIGPEGGWSEKEVSLAQGHGATIASLGKLTLRGETAAIVGVYRVVHSA